MGQVLSNPGCTLLLISSAETDTLWLIGSGSGTRLTIITWEIGRRYRWSNHPSRADKLLLVADNVVHLYEWRSLTRLTTETGIQLLGLTSSDLAVRSMMPFFGFKVIAISFAESLASRSKSRLALWNLDNFAAECGSAVAISHSQAMVAQVEYILGTHGQRLVFLHQDG